MDVDGLVVAIPRASPVFGYHTKVDDASDSRALRQLVDEHRAACLWYLRADYYPTTAAEVERVLQAIERHSDLRALHRVAEFRQ